MPDSIHRSLLVAARQRIVDLELTTTAGTVIPVYRRMFLNETWMQNLQFPCVVVSGNGVHGPLSGDLDESDQTFLPLVIRILDRDPVDSEEKEDDLLYFDQRIRQRFRSGRFTGAAKTWLVTWKAAAVVEEIPKTYKLVSMPLVYDARVDEPRDDGS